LLLVAWLPLAFADPAWARTEVERWTVAGTGFELDAADGMDPYLPAARRVVEAHWSDIAARLAPPTDEGPIRIHVERRFEDWFAREGVPASPPEWAAGLALPSRRVILLAPGNEAWEKTLRHELVHVAVGMASGDGPMPSWVTEGLAVRLADQWDLARVQVLVEAGMRGAFLDMRRLERGWPADPTTAQLAYAQSAHLVDWLQGGLGADVFARVFRVQRTRGGAFVDAWLEETGELLTVTYDRWADTQRARYRWLPTGAGLALLGLAGLVLLALAWHRARRRRVEGLARLARRESRWEGPDPDDQRFG
jgi:hypothetical protein